MKTKMKKFLPAFLTLGMALATFASIAHSEEVAPEDRSADFAFGFDIGSYGNNYGVGLTLASPKFLDNTAWIQLTSDVAWVSGVENGATTESWEPYGLFRLGFMRGRFIEGTPIRVYGGAGVAFVTPSSTVSSSRLSVGGYGLVGVEFSVNPKKSKSMYIELGGLGTGASADRMATSPIYANGFIVSFGVKHYL